MQKRVAISVMMVALAVLGGAPASAQVRLGVDLGAVRIHIAPEAPPRPRGERKLPQPGPNHVWIAGYWDRRGDQWAWAPGRWEEPAQRDSRWIRPQYRQEGRAYRYESGHWSHQRMEEGEDYSNWRREHGRGHEEHGRGHGWGHNKHQDQVREHEREDHREDHRDR